MCASEASRALRPLPTHLLSLFPRLPVSPSLRADAVNVHKVTTYIASRAMRLRPGAAGAADDVDDDATDDEKLQVIVVSLKDAFYERASGLVGVYRDCALDSSGTLTLDLNRFPDAPAQPAPAAAAAARAVVR